MSTNDRHLGSGHGPIYAGLTTFVDTTDNVHVVVETPRLSGSKFKFDEKLQVFVLKTALPKGLVFPYDFGFLPRTRGEDGDPLDVLVIADEPTFAGCVVAARVLGVIRAVQHEDGKPRVRNDRFLVVPLDGVAGPRPDALGNVDPLILDQVESFFVAFGKTQGKTVVIEGRSDADEAVRSIRVGVQRFVDDAAQN